MSNPASSLGTRAGITHKKQTRNTECFHLQADCSHSSGSVSAAARETEAQGLAEIQLWFGGEHKAGFFMVCLG